MMYSRLSSVRVLVFVLSIVVVPLSLADTSRLVSAPTEDPFILNEPNDASLLLRSPSALRSGSPVEWVRVHLPGQSSCPEYSASGDGQTVEHVWCFEGPGGDPSWPAGGGSWDHHFVPGAPAFDGWELAYDPIYADKGNTCQFTDDWLWSAKEGTIPPWANGFQFRLVSPPIPVTGWTGGLVEYAQYYKENGRLDASNILGRAYDTSSGWSVWSDFDGIFILGGGSWSRDRFEDFSDLLGAGVDSIQIAWELIDLSTAGDNTWGRHGGVNYFVDNVSFGSYDGTRTTFTARSIDTFTETYSLSDPAHTAFLENGEQGEWVGTGGARAFADQESLTVGVYDPEGITAGNVLLRWSTDGGGTWHSKAMDLSQPNAGFGGTFRAIIGADDGGTEDMTPLGDGLIWDPGTTVDWYVEATDGAAKTCTFVDASTDDPFRFRVHPFNKTSPSQNGEIYIFVEDNRFSAFDVENSTGFDPTGGLGTGDYAEPAFERTARMIRDALDALGLVYDRYVVQATIDAPDTEPRGFADPAKGLGGLMDESGNPNYDCVIWSTTGGNFGGASFSAESRLNLAAFLDGGGHLLTTGDGIAAHLGTGGHGADPGFLATYLGAELPNSADDETEAKLLDTQGVGVLSGIRLGLYADCPYVRRFDRLTLAPPAGGSSNSVLMEYANGGPGDNGRPSVIANERTASGGRAAITGFDPGALVSLESRACLIGSVLEDWIGLTVPDPSTCPNTGTGVTELAAVRGFRLAAAEPNPFRGRTSVRLTVPRSVVVNLSVYDVTGRQVRTLVSGRLPAGTHAGEWDGNTDSGAPAAAGIYFIRMVAEEYRGSRKAVLLR